MPHYSSCANHRVISYFDAGKNHRGSADPYIVADCYGLVDHWLVNDLQALIVCILVCLCIDNYSRCNRTVGTDSKTAMTIEDAKLIDMGIRTDLNKAFGCVEIRIPKK